MLKNRLFIFVFAFVLGFGTFAWREQSRRHDYRARAEYLLSTMVKVGDDANSVRAALEKAKMEPRYDESMHRFYGGFPTGQDTPFYEIHLDEKKCVKDVVVYYPIIL
jgi:hypothetical protein